MRNLRALAGCTFACSLMMVATLAGADPSDGTAGLPIIQGERKSEMMAVQVCPDEALGEKPEDCPWALQAKLFEQAHKRGERLDGQFKMLAPEIHRQLLLDSLQTGLKSLWGKSINFDENAKGIIVYPATMDSILSIAKAPKRKDRIVHAGLEHTYGYLLSNLNTPYGFKRARWVRPDIESGLGLQSGTIVPDPKEGTLFSNLTYLIGQIALADDTHARSVLEAASSAVAPALKKIDYSKVSRVRLEETTGAIRVRTDFVKLSSGFLLIYSVLNPKDAPHAQLITAFPVDAAFVEKALDPKGIGEQQPIQSRYNAQIQGLTGAKGVKGSRKQIGKFE